MSFTINLIEIAKKDLKASEILYKRGLYSQSYYHFQQASEKANKAFGLFHELITEDELLKLQHNQLKIYRKAIVNREVEAKEMVGFFDKNPEVADHAFFKNKPVKEYHTLLGDGLKFLDSTKNIDLLNISQEDLNYLLSSLQELNSFKPSQSNKSKKITLDELAKYDDLIKKHGNETKQKEMEGFSELNKEDQDELFKSILLFSKNYIQSLYINLTLYVSAVITIRHSNSTRYIVDGRNPLDFYVKKNPIIKYQPEFLWHLNKALKLFEKWAIRYEEHTKNSL